MARYLSHWKVSHFPHGGTSLRLTDKSVYSTLVRIGASTDKMGAAFVRLFEKNGWQRVAMVMSFGFCNQHANGISTALKVRKCGRIYQEHLKIYIPVNKKTLSNVGKRLPV